MKKYNVIYADPPWELKAGPEVGKYVLKNGKQGWDNVSLKSRDTEFNSMTIEQIKSLPVGFITDKNACLYLWVTNKHLPFAFDVINEWGFRYSTTIVWCKNKMGGGLGGVHRITTEFLLYATRGTVGANGKNPGTWHNVKRDYENGFPKHSKKPEYFREMINSLHNGNKLEMFARKESEGWDVYGNEVNNSIVLAAQ